MIPFTLPHRPASVSVETRRETVDDGCVPVPFIPPALADDGPTDRRTPSRTVVNAAKPLKAERNYLKMARDDIAEAVEAFDRRIATPEPTAYSSPVQVGKTEKFRDPYRRGRVTHIHRLLGDEEIIIIVPMRADGSAVDSAVDVLVDTVLGEMKEL